MKAAYCRAYGPAREVMSIRDIAVPEPGKGRIRVRVHAASLNTSDTRVRGFDCPPLQWPILRAVMGFTRPRKPVMGSVFAGVVDAIAPDVTEFVVGDEVYGSNGMGFGCHAEYATMKAAGAVDHKPAGLSFTEAAAIPFGGLSGMYFLEQAGMEVGRRALIYGASGAVGSLSVQIAHEAGMHVTAVCSGKNADLVRDLGAEEVVDYTTTDPTTLGPTFDLVFDAVGLMTRSARKALLKPDGKYATVGGLSVSRERKTDLQKISAMVEAGTFRPVIDSVYPLERIAEAYERVETGHKVGSVVMTIEHDPARAAD